MSSPVSDTISAPLLRLPDRIVLRDRNLYTEDVQVTHQDGSAVIGLSRPAPAPGMPEVILDPIGRCPELDDLLQNTLTLRPPTPTTAWLRVSAGLMVGLCLSTGDVYVHLPITDIQEAWWDDDYDIWAIGGEYVRQTPAYEVGFVVRGSGTPDLHDWWWSLAPTWLRTDAPGRYCIPGAVSEETAGAALWATIGNGDNFTRPLYDLNDVAFTPKVRVQDHWEYHHYRLLRWSDDVVTLTDLDNDLRGSPPVYLPFVLPRLNANLEQRRISYLVEAPAKP